MRALSAAEMLRVWDVAGDRHPIDRALALLCAACPGWKVQQLARLPVGRRNAMLLALRQRMLGPQLRGYGRCPQCRTEVEFSIAISELLQTVGDEVELREATAEEPAEEHTLTTGEHRLRFRLPDSYDLAAIVACQDAREARDELVRRCVAEAVWGARVTSVSGLPDDVVAMLGEKILELDRLAEVQLESKCPQCDCCWPAVLDIASFFWHEISVRSKRLLQDVHLLARAYAWSEAEILAMSDRRRQYYLDLVT